MTMISAGLSIVMATVGVKTTAVTEGDGREEQERKANAGEKIIRDLFYEMSHRIPFSMAVCGVRSLILRYAKIKDLTPLSFPARGDHLIL